MVLFANDPSHKVTFSSMGGVDYIIGAMLIILGFLVFFAFNNKAKRKIKEYKQLQLDVYNKNRGTKITDYNNTNLFLPPMVKFETSAPILLMILFVAMGVFWIIWTATGTPITTL